MVKKFINFISSWLSAIKARISKKKQGKASKKISISLITVNGNNAAISNSTVDSQDALENVHAKAIRTIVNAMRHNSDEQVKLNKELKTACENANGSSTSNTDDD